MKKLYLIFMLLFGINLLSQTNCNRTWSTYVGDVNYDQTNIIKDLDGNIYTTTVIRSKNGISLILPTLPTNYYSQFTTIGAYQTNFNSTDKNLGNLISKFSPTGVLLWSTYLDSYVSEEIITDLAIDSNNNLYVTGWFDDTNGWFPLITESANFTNNTHYKGFISKFTPSGTYLYGKYLPLIPTSILFDSNNQLYLYGNTQKTTQVTTPDVFQETINLQSGQFATVIACFDDNINKIWATYYGFNNNYILSNISNYRENNSIELDNNNNIYILGKNIDTNPPNFFATSGCFLSQNTSQSDQYGNYISKFNNLGQRVWSTYFGSSESGTTTNILDLIYDNGFIYFSGNTNASTGIATTGSYQPSKSGAIYNPAPGANNTGTYDVFLNKFDLDGNRIWGTYFGGTGYDGGCSIAIKDNRFYLTGITSSALQIATLNSFQPTYNYNADSFLNFDGFIVQFNTDGTTKNWATYFGGDSCDTIDKMILNNDESFYISGNTNSANNIVTTGCNQPLLNIGSNANYWYGNYLARFDPIPLNINENEINNITYIFPNPNNGNFTITNKDTNCSSITIFDNLGRLVYTKYVNPSDINETINLENQLQSGIYFVKLMIENNVWKTTKMIVK